MSQTALRLPIYVYHFWKISVYNQSDFSLSAGGGAGPSLHLKWSLIPGSGSVVIILLR